MNEQDKRTIITSLIKQGKLYETIQECRRTLRNCISSNSLAFISYVKRTLAICLYATRHFEAAAFYASQTIDKELCDKISKHLPICCCPCKPLSVADMIEEEMLGMGA